MQSVESNKTKPNLSYALVIILLLFYLMGRAEIIRHKRQIYISFTNKRRIIGTPVEKVETR